jgi:crotonyl-CoA carboxylase/reductase
MLWLLVSIIMDVIRFCNKKGDKRDYFIGGSDAAGVVWKIGAKVKNVKVGDEVILHGGYIDYNDRYLQSGQVNHLPQNILAWGYEVNDGALAQYARVQEQQCIPKPNDLTWLEAACFMVSGATAYRMLHGWPPHTLKAGEPVLIWGGAGGLGSIAIQLCRLAEAKAVAVISNQKKVNYCKELGAVGVINRTEFSHWGEMPSLNDREAYKNWRTQVKRFQEKFWQELGSEQNPTIIFEHPGACTLPTSIMLLAKGGMVVICAGTSGYYGSFDLRHLWVNQKRLQGSHFAGLEQCKAITELVANRKIRPGLCSYFDFSRATLAHQLLADNKAIGNLSISINTTIHNQKTFLK